ncbi:MAG: cytochrome c biosis protein transrane region [Acidimicrobiia bacterium]|nr:cytochrome c biosis protein transrane region [Acidimicrobiia bacterium]
MLPSSFALSLMTGMLAALSPCGFAMLPAYLSYFVGVDNNRGGDGGSSGASIHRALLVGLTMTVAALAVFTPIGVVVKATGMTTSDFTHAAKWPAVTVAAGLVALGVALLAGWHLPWATPRLDKGGQTRSLASIAVFGFSFAITSLSCSFPLFFGSIINSFGRSGFLEGLSTFVGYGLGMGLVITALTVAIASGQSWLVTALRVVMRYLDRIAGLLLIAAGSYLAWYWLGRRDSGQADPVERFASRLQDFVNRQGADRAVLVLGAVIAVGAIFAFSHLQPEPHDEPDQGASRSIDQPSSERR